MKILNINFRALLLALEIVSKGNHLQNASGITHMTLQAIAYIRIYKN
jgi:hypothetical protein